MENHSGELRKRAEFWLKIYTELDQTEGVIHDGLYPYVILEKITGASEKEIARKKKRYCALLSGLDGKVQGNLPLTGEEARIAAAYREIRTPGKFFAAAHFKRLRFQRGQRDAFARGIQASGRYLPAMERIFEEMGVPKEITRLPFVESSFNTEARSKVGASGVWQFIPSTAGVFLKIGPAVDERNDPIRSTVAAARLLRANYETLGTWPLAITAYNHGRKALLRATLKYGTNDLNALFSAYRMRSFGFASGNFFAELLAAIEAERNSAMYFSAIERSAAERTIETALPRPMLFAELRKKLAGLDAKAFQKLNPSLTSDALGGKTAIPAGTLIRTPETHPLVFSP